MKLKTPLFLFASAFVVACGGSDKPAQDPSTTTSTTSADTTTVTPLPSDSTNATMGSPSSTDVTTPMGNGNTMPTGTPGSSSSSTNTTDPSMATTGSATPSAGDTTMSNGPNADNTKNNKRDSHGSTLTPVDQGNSKSETDITASIRKSVVADKSLSFTAKNVKIITTGTKVTLRGPVKTDQEKATIESLAKQATGVTSVDDQIEVKK